MSHADDPSSSDDEGIYRTTNVTLGYASREPTDDDVSHVGGQPTWLDDKSQPSAALVTCKVCNGLTSLLLQLNADLQQHFPQDSRRLYVFCCRKKTCSKKPGSIRALRETRKPQQRMQEKPHLPEASPQQPQDLGGALFGQPATRSAQPGHNPFSMATGTLSQSQNPFSSLPPLSSLAAKPPQQPEENTELPTETFADKLRIADAPEPSNPARREVDPEPLAFANPFTLYHLDADAEELEPESATGPAPRSGESSKGKYDVDDAGGTTDKDTFESNLDKTFQKFSDRIAQNPEQVLRYEYRGQPLLYSGSDGIASRFIVPHGKTGAARGIPRCESCGAQRVFELQLVPGLIYELEKDEALDLEDGMEWGTIIFGTCMNNCGEPGAVSFREEWAGVQWEERIAPR